MDPVVSGNPPHWSSFQDKKTSKIKSIKLLFPLLIFSNGNNIARRLCQLLFNLIQINNHDFQKQWFTKPFSNVFT